MNFFKRIRCHGCARRFKKHEKGSEVQLDTLEGLHTIKLCDGCTLILEQMRTAAIGQKEEASDD